MSLTLMIDMRLSGRDAERGRWVIEFERPVMVPALPPIGAILCLSQEEDDCITPDEMTIKRIVYVEGDDYFRCQIDQSGWPNETLNWKEVVAMAEKCGWKRIG